MTTATAANEYVKQVQDFLENVGAELTIEYIGIRKPLWGEREVNAYWFTIERNNMEYSATFYDSVHNTKMGIEPTEYDILAALQKHEVGTFFNFCEEFGYEVRDKYDEVNEESMAIYRAVIQEELAIAELFEDCMDELREIW